MANLGRNCDIIYEFDGRLKELGIQIPNHFVSSLFNTIHEEGGSKLDEELASLKLIQEEEERREKLRVLFSHHRP